MNMPEPTERHTASRRLRLAALVLRLYPAAWRERYGDEMLAVLEQHRATPRTWLNLGMGALDAHLHHDLLTGKVVPMLQRLRSGAIATFCAIVIFGVAIAFLGRTTDPQPPFDAVAHAHPEIGLAFSIIQYAADAAALALLVGGIPILISAFRRTVLRNHRNLFGLFAMRWRDVLSCYLAGVALVVGFIIYQVLSGFIGHQVAFPTVQIAQIPLLLLGVLALALLPFVVILATALVALAVSRSDIGARALHIARIGMIIATLAMAIGFVATVFWTARIWLDDQAFFQSGDGLVGGWPMLIILPMMLLAVLLAGGATWRGIRTPSASVGAPGVAAR
jgi:hypothetical protein